MKSFVTVLLVALIAAADAQTVKNNLIIMGTVDGVHSKILTKNENYGSIFRLALTTKLSPKDRANTILYYNKALKLKENPDTIEKLNELLAKK
jgi:hypothetical protein